MADISTLDPNILNADTDFEQNIIHDLWISLVSREASLLGRKEVLCLYNIRLIELCCIG